MAKLVYCRCAFADVVDRAVKDDVLRGLCEAGASFESVPDLCEMSARKDPKLAELLREGPLKIAACYPRAVKWMFHAAGTGFQEGSEGVEVVNMRELPAESVLREMLQDERGE